MALSRKQKARIGARMTVLYREVGTLLLAFAPLDYLQRDTVNVLELLAFLSIGVSLFGWSVFREMRGER